jgi:hypothetical protein
LGPEEINTSGKVIDMKAAISEVFSLQNDVDGYIQAIKGIPSALVTEIINFAQENVEFAFDLNTLTPGVAPQLIHNRFYVPNDGRDTLRISHFNYLPDNDDVLQIYFRGERVSAEIGRISLAQTSDFGRFETKAFSLPASIIGEVGQLVLQIIDTAGDGVSLGSGLLLDDIDFAPGIILQDDSGDRKDGLILLQEGSPLSIPTYRANAPDVPRYEGARRLRRVLLIFPYRYQL